MSAQETRFRRNFIIAGVLHVAIIAGIIFWESLLSDGGKPALASVELITPADILGDLPKGPCVGRGAYRPASEPPGANAVAGPSEQMSPPDETPEPQRKAVSLPKADPNDIALPRKNESKKKVVTAAKTATSAKKAAPASAKARTGTATGKSLSAEEIRNHFAKALAAAEDGTPYGDGKTAGGGSGKSSRIGSPNGSPDGMVGGIGQGSPFWQYYLHVHDQMYEAWEQPGSLLDKKLVATVLLRVGPDGTIVDASLRIPSGNKLMDNSVLAAVRKVQRLDPPPDALLRGPSANITVDFQVEG